MARKTGKHATLTIGAYTGADLYNVEVRMTADLVDVTALNDDWVERIPGVGSWEVHAEKYYATEAFLSLVKATPTATGPVTVQVKEDGETVVFQGTGYVTEGALTVPNEAISERIVVVGTGAPSVP